MDKAILLTSTIAAAGIVYDTIEFWQARSEVLEKFYNWRVIRSRYYILINRPILAFLFDFIFARKTFMTLVITHGIAAAAFPIAFYLNHSVGAILACYVFGVHAITNIRLLVGRDGADQMQNIIWAGLFAYCLPLGDVVHTVAAGFIAAQLVLSYLTSGMAKLISPVWRNGDAIYLVTRMSVYSPPGLSALFKEQRVVSIVICWMTILFETFSPALLFFDVPGALVFITMGTVFHLGIAISMGLTTFVFAFVATYPIIFELATR